MTAIANPPALILAGGRASRMGGGDKPLLLLHDRPLLSWVIERLKPQCDHLAISANGDEKRFSAYGLPVLADTVPDHPGPLAGIVTGLEWAAACGGQAVLSVSGDTPFLPHDFAARLQAAGPLAYAASNGRDHPTLALWPVSQLATLKTALLSGERALFRLLTRLNAARVAWSAQPIDPFFNINTPDDLEKAHGLMPSPAPLPAGPHAPSRHGRQ